MSMIRESIVVTVNARGEPHLAPLGLIAEGEGWILAPFHPSTTLDNLRQAPFAVANFTDDVRIFAGCLTGRRDWPLKPATLVAAPRLAATLSHLELVVVAVREHEQRPRFVCRVAHRASHAPFQGFNRAQAAVIEGAVLVSRLHLLPRAEVEAEIRRRLIADRDAQAVAATLRRPLPEDVEFLNASRVQLADLRQTVRPLARKMAARLAHKRRHRRRAALDFRRTVRKSLASGGVPVDLAYRKPRPAKPEIMLVADISGSVSAFAGFTMQLAYAMKSEFSRVRSFVFVDGVEEVTDILEAAADVTSVTHRLNLGTRAVRLDGHSDYGLALETFWDRWGGQVRSRTSVIILGDGRNNYHASRAWVLTAIRQRARHLYWLNPEPAEAWDTGDSIMREYAPGCDLVVECRNLRQLRAFVEQLD